ncbi:MAG: hypothetical protein IKC47_04270, partial [Clostridia bacterium]|nr:hypothetical protein [Clostridia bacterium]
MKKIIVILLSSLFVFGSMFLIMNKSVASASDQVLAYSQIVTKLENGEYDCYTDSDKYYGLASNSALFGKDIKEYEHELTTIDWSKDDEIIYIIPREMLITPGVYSYMGREYGFYVDTFNTYPDENRSRVIVFDIEEPIQQLPVGCVYQVSVEILLCEEYICNFSMGVIYRNENDPMAQSELSILDIKVGLQVANEYEANANSESYSQENDEGMIFTEGQVGYQVTCDSEFDVLETAKVMLLEGIGYIPYIGPVYSVLSSIYEIANTLPHREVVLSENMSGPNNFLDNGTYNYYPSHGEQLDNYGFLVKGIVCDTIEYGGEYEPDDFLSARFFAN